MNDEGSNYTKMDIESVLFLEKSCPYIFDDSGKYNYISQCFGSGNIDIYLINKTLYSIDKHKIKNITANNTINNNGIIIIIIIIIIIFIIIDLVEFFNY